MRRQERREPTWPAEQAEEAWDRKIANKYGFPPGAICAARQDLIFYMQVFYSDPFLHHTQLRRDVSRVRAQCLKCVDQLDVLLADVPAWGKHKFGIVDIIEGIRERADRLEAVRRALPMRVDDIKRPAVKRLLSAWIHEPIRSDLIRDRNIPATAFNETSIHPCVDFIQEFFRHMDKKFLGDVSVSTIRRARKELGEVIPTSKEIAPWTGDPAWLDEG